uniref:Putative secreted protein n=1 Tax=Xenopsylla cheopis TaxID=163159 RepID=A0A6M2DZX0_XENCH
MTSIPQLSVSFFRFSSLTALCRVLAFHVPNLRGPVSLLSLLLMTRPSVPSTRSSERVFYLRYILHKGVPYHITI